MHCGQKHIGRGFDVAFGVGKTPLDILIGKGLNAIARNEKIVS